ncbi:hypothetical protein ACQ86B_02445 [Mycolicibacterium aichiense]|uniref:hypothetical protein n=1 Tax=Mycolicibacterium aichiense TaxID=1799 RepID=UPI003D676340
MKRLVIGMAVTVFTVVLGLFGAAEAAAAGPDVTGYTYAKATETISAWGYAAVISSVVGDQLPTSDCIVTSSGMASNLDSSGRSRGKQVLLNLNCNQTLAGPGKPGNSAATPQGRQAKAIQDKADILSDDVTKSLAAGKTPYCGKGGVDTQACKDFCDKNAGVCSQTLLDFLATV